ncbi:MAG: hypothetical protein IPJ06_05345 [Saprospiraceae bacterium]|nr:hypothetical protein [Saprospiraceae bacterium]
MQVHVQKITVSDKTPPVLVGIPSDITANCDGGNIPQPAVVTATDNCDNSVQVTFVETKVDGTCPDSYTLNRVWTATDNCGNTVSGKQTISVGDVTPPEFVSTPVDLTVECDGVPVLVGVPTDITANCDGGNIPPVPTITATDNCDNSVTVTFVETQIDGTCPNSFTLIRTWTATDNCGNSTSGKQEISVGDTTPPEFDTDPVDLTVECDAVPGVDAVTATDNCDPNVTCDL